MKNSGSDNSGRVNGTREVMRFLPLRCFVIDLDICYFCFVLYQGAMGLPLV